MRRSSIGTSLTRVLLPLAILVACSPPELAASGIPLQRVGIGNPTGISRAVTRAGQVLAHGDLVRDSVYLLDASGRRRWQVVAARDPVTGQASPFVLGGRAGGLTIVPSDPILVPTVVDLDEILLEVRSIVGFAYSNEGQVSTADLDGAGRADLVFRDRRHRICILLSAAMPRGVVDLDLEQPDAAVLRTARSTECRGAWASDIDGDGHTDLVAALASAMAGYWYEVHRGPFLQGDVRNMDSTAPDSKWTQLRETCPHFSSPVGDLDGDGRGDVAITEIDRYFEPEARVIVFGASPLPAIIDVSDRSSPHVLRIEIDDPDRSLTQFGLVDFDGDGRDELAHYDGGFLSLQADGIRGPGVVSASDLPLPLRLCPVPIGGEGGPRRAPSACGSGDAMLIDGTIGILDGAVRNGVAHVFEPRPAAFWQPEPPAAPDQSIFGPPFVASVGVWIDPFLLADLDGDGFRDAALANSMAADGSMTTTGSGVIVARSMGGVQPDVAILDETASLEQLAEADTVRFGSDLRSGDFDGDGINDLVVTGLEVGTGLGIIRVYKGKRWTDVPDSAGCAEVVSVSSGATTTTSPAAADAAVAAWGRIDDPGRAFDPMMQVAPARGPAAPGDPVLEVDGEQLATVLDPPGPAGRNGAYRGRLARSASGPIVAEVPGVPDVTGAQLLCLDPRHRAPLVVAGPDQVLTIALGATDCSLPVTIAGTTHDLDCDDVTSWWEESGVVVASTLDATLDLGVGVHELTLVARDVFDVGSDALTVQILDVTPPDLSASVPIPCLWPPDHRLVDIRLGRDIVALVSDDCDATPAVRIVAATSSEPEDDLGDGHHAPDVVMASDDVVQLRRERSGLGRGRTYTIVIDAADASGNRTTATVEIIVPHDQADRRCPVSRRGGARGSSTRR